MKLYRQFNLTVCESHYRVYRLHVWPKAFICYIIKQLFQFFLFLQQESRISKRSQFICTKLRWILLVLMSFELDLSFFDEICGCVCDTRISKGFGWRFEFTEEDVMFLLKNIVKLLIKWLKKFYSCVIF